jgi:hypothetical protein
VLETTLGAGVGVPGTGFGGTLIRGNKGIDSIDTPAEALTTAIINKDQAEVGELFKEAAADGLNVDELAKTVERRVKTQLLAEEKDAVDYFVKELLAADTKTEREELIRQMMLYRDEGRLTELGLKEIESQMKAEMKKESIGEY